jgi:bifunctional UDP-N-acetylglucosamine pyrophosphorylase/glucosamine-1-phosphate N-acetyltransferase
LFEEVFMSNTKRAAVILAAGAGTRMKSKLPKVAHEILGLPLVKWVIRAAEGAGLDSRVAVLGHGADVVAPLVRDMCETAIQEQQLGTADAVMCAMSSDALAGFEGSVVVLSGDCPLITSDTLVHLCEARETVGAGCAVLTMRMENPYGYGRIIRSLEYSNNSINGEGETLTQAAFPIISRIVEQKDASIEELAVNECNSGFYCFDAAALRDALTRVGSDNAQGEFYLTDVIGLMREDGLATIAVEADGPAECAGINNRVQLAEATAVLQARINHEHMVNGVTIVDPRTTWIGPDVKIDQDVTILPATGLFGKTSVGEDSVIGPNTRLTDTIVGRGCTVDETVAIEAQIDDEATTGPRAYLRPAAHLCRGAKAGTHVEIKKSTIGEGSKVPHLSYIGDTTMGSSVNIGAGSITCNYDGANKHATVIGDDVFIGSDTMMVAPVKIGDRAVVGAGSTITRDVPEDALCVARARERLIEDWASTHAKHK